ncbi:macrolide-specific efflux protein MacA [Virgisporangium ochraceum]|uniref:Macrolide-specific efflux protein MacA n=1 Tax=Virgisporangium ochraceum TaxID=65505 RepID=A0A8J3ZVR8_9ACTN|nr:macrolide-specific efflux protein MacA [Virgisporangium ochraceum]
MVVVVASVAVVALTRPDGRTAAGTGTATVRRGTVTATVSAAGTVVALESRTLGFAAAGTLTEVTVRAGDTVPAGAVLARIDATAAQSAVDTARAAVDSAEEDLDDAEAQSSGATPGRSASAGTGRSQSTDAVYSAQLRLNNAKLALKQAQARLAGTVITAPVAGRVLSVDGAVGSQARSGVVVLAGTADVAVQAQFTEAEVASLATGQTATITLPDRDSDADGAGLTGTVTRIDPAGTVSNRLVRYAAVIAFDAAPGSLLYGQSANVVVTTEAVDGVLFVPTTAVVNGAVTVMVGGRAERRAVEVGLRGDVSTEVRSGVNEGDEVLVSGG